MKNISLVLNGVLLVAVAILFYLHFSANSSSGTSETDAVNLDLKIAYINSDSVLKYYDYFKVNREKLETKGKKMDQDFRNRAQTFQNELANYQRNAGNLTINQAKAVEEDLAKKQQNLRVYQESLQQELMNEESKMNQQLYEKITAFLKDYGKANGLQIVFKYDPTSDVLYGGESLDITQIVIEGLNQSYQNEQNQPDGKDSPKDSIK
ncbi:MAG: OmpH family outer membrane protein [Flammeovirgaceae bacterium]|nr:OmpH family outer membrane protein [Flammeovirgaceae bacterium]